MNRSVMFAAVVAAVVFSVAALAAQPDMFVPALHAAMQHVDVGQWLYAVGPLAVSGAGIRALKGKKATAVGAMRAITDKATAESRDLSAEEQTQFDAHAADVRSLNAQIEREELLAQEVARRIAG